MTTTTPFAGAPDNDSATTIDDGLAWPVDFDRPLRRRPGPGRVAGRGRRVLRGVAGRLPARDRRAGRRSRGGRTGGRHVGGLLVASVLGVGNHLGRFFREVVAALEGAQARGGLAPAVTCTRVRHERATCSAWRRLTTPRPCVRSVTRRWPRRLRRPLQRRATLRSSWIVPLAFVLAPHLVCRHVLGRAVRRHESSKVGIGRAVAASSVVPGLFAPQQIGDRRCMDGGVSGTGTHLDLIAGAGRAVVLSLTDGSGDEAMMTMPAGAAKAEFTSLRDSGTEVFSRQPEQSPREPTDGSQGDTRRRRHGQAPSGRRCGCLAFVRRLTPGRKPSMAVQVPLPPPDDLRDDVACVCGRRRSRLRVC